MYPNGIAIIALNTHGVHTAQKIQAALAASTVNSTVYAPQKYAVEGVVAIPENQNLPQFITQIYNTTDAIVAVMAAGIIIREIAPHLQSKLVDPAVVCVDISGNFVISLLSGHYGGANQLTRLIVSGIGATPVITTASDTLGKQSVDDLARQLHIKIVNPASLVAVNSALVNGERLAAVLVGKVKFPAGVLRDYAVERAETVDEALRVLDGYDAGFIVCNEASVAVLVAGKPVTVLTPKRVVVGLGARKEITKAQVLDAIDEALSKVNLPVERVDGLVTVDIKKSSKSMIDAVAQLGFTLGFVSVDELGAFSHPELSPDSKIVQKNFGVGGVCERAALMATGKNNHLILKKLKHNGVTVAIATGE
ncbi:MAG: cobalt-precorrin 5A hydrolase [Candidatus Bathyarchaeota archaeon]|nr:cobalt-precorrin 5A hydrolase [Candidatus Bathyarchaeota archaeon]